MAMKTKKAGTNLIEQFINQFDIMVADTPEKLELVYRVRGDVYCREFKFEAEEDCPGGLEQDQYDEHSVHCLIVHRASKLPAGCIRLILSSDADLEKPLPFEHFYDNSSSDSTVDLASLSRYRIAEVSRLAVHKDFRKPRTGGECGESDQSCFGLLSTALFVAATVLSEQIGCSDNFAMMEPGLAERMKMGAGFDLRQIGEVTEYHGLRAAYHVTTESMLATMRKNMGELHQFISARLADHFALPVAA